MAIEGPLRELSIHDVFQLLDLSRKTGVLRISSELRRNQGRVYFDGGAVVYAEIKSNPHPLGALLVRAGKIDEADLTRAREMQQRGDKRRLGGVLVAINAIMEKELERQVRFQIEEVIFEVMNWREGYFSFVEGPLESLAADATVRIPTEALLMEGARRIDEWSQIERKIPHLGVVPTLAPVLAGSEGQLDLLPPEWEVLAAIDSTRDLRTIAGLLGRSEFDVAKTVFGLASAGVLMVADPRGVREAAPEVEEDVLDQAVRALEAGDLEGARARAEAGLATHPHEAALHLILGRVHLSGGRPADAAECLRRALRVDSMLAPAHRLLGNALALQGRLGEAIEWWQRWLTMAQHAGEGEGEAEVSQVEAAIQAARSLDGALKGPHV